MHPCLAHLDQSDDLCKRCLSEVSGKASGLLLQELLQVLREMSIIQSAQGDLGAGRQGCDLDGGELHSASI